MAKYTCEIFGHIVYNADLTYDELYALEADLSDDLREALEANAAEHIDFVALGDSLRVQCVHAEYDEPLFHDICESIAAVLPDSVTARFLFVHKALASLHLYAFLPEPEKHAVAKLGSKGTQQWKEAVIDTSLEACKLRSCTYIIE